MNKPSIKYIRLNNGDVISTSGEAYWVMENCGNNIAGDMKFTSPEGEVINNAAAQVSTAKLDLSILTEGYVAELSYLAEAEASFDPDTGLPYDKEQFSDLNGKYTFNSSTNIFTKVE